MEEAAHDKQRNGALDAFLSRGASLNGEFPVSANRLQLNRSIFPGGHMPPPETPRQKRIVRSVALSVLAVTAVYLSWRIAFTLDGASPLLAALLLALELHAFASLALLTFSLWDIDSLTPAAPVKKTSHRIAVLIPTSDERAEILLPTVAAAVALDLPHETWVLDDSDRDEIRDLALRLGAKYLARPNADRLKASNINYALGVVEADLVAVLDADHVPVKDFLRKTVGYFDDPKVAFVQTPQEFFDIEFFERGRVRKGTGHNPQAMFYRVTQPGKNRWNAAYWCGTGAVLRTDALRNVGGVATDLASEDILTSIRLHKAGWRSVYHNEVLTRGLAASNASEYAAARKRWGRGALTVMKIDNPVFGKGLTWQQRLAYFSTLFGWFESWRTLGYVALPALILILAGSPADPSAALLAAFLAVTALQQIATWTLGRRKNKPSVNTVTDLLAHRIHLSDALSRILHQASLFNFAPARHAEHANRQARQTASLWGMFLLSLSGLIFAFVGFSQEAQAYEDNAPFVALAVAWSSMNLLLVLRALQRFYAQQHVWERRSAVRFPVHAEATVDDKSCRVEDLSVSGALIRLDDPSYRIGQKAKVRLKLDTEWLDFDAVIRAASPYHEGRTMKYGVQFDSSDPAQRAQLAVALFTDVLVLEPTAVWKPAHLN